MNLGEIREQLHTQREKERGFYHQGGKISGARKGILERNKKEGKRKKTTQKREKEIGR